MIRGSIQEEDIILINICTQIGASKCIKQILTDIKGEIDRNTIIVGYFNTTLTSMDQSSIQEISKATEILNDTIEQLDLIDIYRKLHPKTPEYTFFSNTHGTFSRIDHILRHKTSLNTFKRIEVISSIFSHHNGKKLEINHRKKNRKKKTLHGD